jgi:hypothetical protein
MSQFPASWPILGALNFTCQQNLYLFNSEGAAILWVLRGGTYMRSVYKEVATLMADLKQCVALTAAGISAKSGIVTFRSKEGQNRGSEF